MYKTIIHLLFYNGVKQISYAEARTKAHSVRKQRAEKNIWTSEGGNTMRVKKVP
jgi:hypothetical protein